MNKARLRCLRAVLHLLTSYRRWSAAAEGLPVRLNTHARRARFGCLSHGGSVPKRHSYRRRRSVDSKCAILSVVVGAVLAGTQPCVVAVWKALIHPCLQHVCGGVI